MSSHLDAPPAAPPASRRAAPTAAAVAHPARLAALEPRLHAYALDRLLGWGLPLGLAWPLAATDRSTATVVVGSLALALALFLVTVVLVGTRGATPGMLAVGLRAVGEHDARPAGLVAAVRRQGVLALAGLPTFGLGLATLAWTAASDPDGRRRGWHDRVGGTVVLDVRPVPTAEAAPARPQPIVNVTAMRLAHEAAATPPAGPPPGPLAGPGPSSATPPARAPLPADPPPADPPAGRAAPAAPTPRSAAAPARERTPPPEPPPAASPTPAPPVRGRRRAGRPPTAAPPAAAAPAPAAPAGWALRFDSGETVTVEGLTLVGRDPEPRPGETVATLVPLRSQDMSLSKTHAQVQPVADGSLAVMDRGSTNGSVLLRQGVPRHLTAGRPVTLLDGDLVRLGDRTMQVSRA